MKTLLLLVLLYLGINIQPDKVSGKRIRPNEHPQSCPVGKQLVRCLINPCRYATCKARPNAKCIPNYCGGCLANFFNKKGEQINCKTGCPVSKPQVNCFVNPCRYATCKARPNAKCIPNYCGGCFANFFNKKGEQINCKTGCPVSKPQVNCFVNPCRYATCKARPNAKCIPSYCGGCFANFFNKRREQINCKTGCPVSKPQVSCFVNPCQFAKCSAYPDAKCVPNYCGGCFARFYDSHGNQVRCGCPKNLKAVNCGRRQP